MQFIEKSSFGVRSVIYRLKKDGAPLEFCLFPMIHVGSREFYAGISARLSQCDLILAEGIKTKKASLLIYSYSIVKNIRRMDLVLQRDAIDVASFGSRWVNVDMERQAFDARWSSLPILLRIQLFLIVPIYVAYLFIFGNRQTLAEDIALEDLPTNEEVLSSDDNLEMLDALVIDERDRVLIDHLERVEKNTEEIRQIGIIYGARHMRSIAAYLMQKLHYRVTKAEWISVFDL
jgi:hypothetical protein